MFSRRNRLSREEISQVTRGGRSRSTPLLSIKTMDNKPSDGPHISKFAFVMGKSEAKSAVYRNRAKRRVRAAMRKLIPNQDKPILCIIFIKKSVLTATFDDIVLNLTKALHHYV